jgi:two-component system OmpR family sensor kinase/two-component system sensor histidine kinase BaeS
MIKRRLNRLWIRFSLSITILILAITVLPAASLLLVTPQEIIDEQSTYLEALNKAANLRLSAVQIERLSAALAENRREIYLNDVQFLTLTTLVVGMVAGILLGRGLSLPIERLATATKAVASQELDHRVEVEGAQEIQDLAANFNQMVASLAHSEQLRRNMMADVSHELLTPLTVLQGNLRAILDDVYALDKEEIGKLYAQNKHLIRLVRDLRQVSQAEAGQLPLHKTAVDMNTLAHETIATFIPLAQEKNIALVCQFDAALPKISVDADRLRQVLHNLLANALRHTPQGGRITLLTELLPTESRLEIADTGAGIAAAALPHVFDRFWRSEATPRRDSGGAGLGLAISKAIIEQHNGRMEVTSEGANLGSAFSIWLPIESRSA